MSIFQLLMFLFVWKLSR